jgi:amino acid adenylation domain-containing protein
MLISSKARPTDLAAWVEATARRAAAEPAVISADGVRTYQQLDRDADAVAHALRESGVGPDQVVGVALPNGPELVAGLLGVLKAGDAYLPVDQAGPATRTRRILADASVAALIGPRDVRDRLAPHAAAVDPAELLGTPRVRCQAADVACPGRLAYIYYTSGSTGEPKGAGMPMEPLINLLDWELDRMHQRQRAHRAGPEAGRQKRVLHFTRPTFDVSFQEIFATLVAGDCLVTVEEERRRDPQYLIELMCEHGVERAYIPPMVLAQLAGSGLGLGVPLQLWDLVVAGGSLRLTAEIRQFLGTLDHPVLDDQYGMTEVHTVMARMLTGAPSGWPTRVAFSDKVSNVSVAILDERFDEANGRSGEICARGACVGYGYFGRPGLTADRFVADASAATPGARMYRTGDVGRRLPDGSIEVRGRLDDQIKLRGHRVTLGEIEHVLMAVPGVARVSVLSGGVDEHQRLVAYVVPEEHGARLVADDLRLELQDKLPAYMIPDFFVMLDDLPLNRHGKVDRSRLKHWHSAGVNEVGMSATQAAIGRIWGSALGAWIEGPDVHFFRCGGNSVLATMVTAQIRRHFSRELPFDAIFKFPVLADLAKTVEDAPPSDEPGITAAPSGRAVAASADQLRLWFEHQVHADPCAYNLAWASRLTGPIEVGALRTALEGLTKRHSVLRTVFSEGADHAADSDLLQLVLEDCPAGYFEVIDAPSPGDVAGMIEECRSTPFDLMNGPLHRTFLIRVAPDDAVLLFTGHHIILDAWSEDLIRRDLSELYTAQVSGRALRLPDVVVQYRDYSQWHSRRRGTEPLARQAGYWRARLRDAPVELPIPLMAPRQAVSDSTGAARTVQLNSAVTGSLRAIAVQEGVTPLVVMLSIFGLALKQVCGANDVIVGVPASGRSRVGLENAVGFFVNSLPIRMDLTEEVAGADSFREVLAEVRTSVLGAFANQDVPFDDIVKIVAPPRSPGRNPLFQAWLAFDDPPARLRLDGAATSPIELPVARVRVDLALHVRRADAAIRGEVTYKANLLSEETADRIARGFENIAAAAAEMADAGAAQAPQGEGRRR